MVGMEGFEPPITESKSVALPLGDIPKLLLLYINSGVIIWKFEKSQN